MKGGQAVSGIDDGYTVFRSLEEAKVPGRKLAASLGVTPSTYSKWRSGRVSIPASRLVLLTLILADRIDALESSLGSTDQRNDPRFLAHLKTLRRGLDYQETLNRELRPQDVRDGSRLFRQWWLENAPGATAGDRNSMTGEATL